MKIRVVPQRSKGTRSHAFLVLIPVAKKEYRDFPYGAGIDGPANHGVRIDRLPK